MEDEEKKGFARVGARGKDVNQGRRGGEGLHSDKRKSPHTFVTLFFAASLLLRKMEYLIRKAE